MGILFTADWQAEYENLDLCARARDEVFALCTDRNVQTIVIAGDLKRQYNPVDVRVASFWVDFVRRARARGVRVVLVLGNHDRVGMYDDRQNWFPILRRAGVSAYDHAGVHTEEDSHELSSMLYVLPFTSDIGRWKKSSSDLAGASKRDVKEHQRVLVFHSELRGASYNVLSSRSESEYRLSDLHPGAYDFCIGGHVHLHQQVSRNVWYVGSPFVTDWGEANQKKGYLVLKSKNLEFVQSEIPGWYDPTWPRFPKSKVNWRSCRVRIHVPCPVGKDYTSVVDSAQNEASKKYSGALISAVVEFEEERPSKIQVRSDSSDRELVEAYVTQTLPDELSRDKSPVCSFLAHHLIRASSALGYRGTHPIQFVRGSASQFLSFESLSLDLRRQGLVLVTGRNEDWAGRSNGAGKSNLMSLIPVALFGQTFKGQRHDAWARRRVKGTSTTDLQLRVGTREIRILRSRRPHKLRLVIDGKDQSSGSQPGETQELIERLTGLTWKTLENSVYVDQALVSEFLLGTQKQKKEVLERFQNLERFTEALSSVKQEQDKVLTCVQNLEGLVVILKAEVQQVKTSLSEMPTDAREQFRRASRRYERFRRKFGVGKSASVDAISVVEQSLRICRKRTEIWKLRLLKYQRSESDLCRALEAIRKSKEKYRGILSLEKRMCPTCLGPIRGERLLQLISIAENEEVGRRKLLFEVQAQVKVATEQFKKLGVRSTRLETEKAQLETRLENLKETNSQLLNEQSGATKLMLGEREARQRCRRRLDGLNLRLARAQTAILHYKEMEAFYQYCCGALSRSGLPAFLNQQLCPVLNHSAAEFSEIFCGKEIQVRFSVTDEGEFDVTVLNTHGGKSLSDQSTGEKKLAALVTAFALREVAPKSSLLILDEPGDGLDAPNARAFAQGLRKLSRRWETILVASHNVNIVSELSDARVWRISKSRGKSILVVE